MTTSIADPADAVETVAAALQAHNIEVVVVDTADQARDAVLAMIPDGAEVHSAKSKTLQDVGLYAELIESGRYDAVRTHLATMDRSTQGREMRKLTAAPDWEVGSVSAITLDGAMVAASATGSQLGAYAAGAGRLILVIGAQKIVPDLDAAMHRIQEVVFPYENAEIRQKMGVDTRLEKLLILYGEWNPGRTTVVLVREPVGV